MNEHKKFHSTLSYLPFVVVIVILPLVFRSGYFTSVMVLVAMYAVLSTGMVLLIGYAGLLSFAHPTWFGLGAYVAGILAAKGICSAWLGILFGALFVGVFAYIVGAPLLRLRGYYLACATFAILLIAQVAAGQLSWLTGGHEGLLGVPALTLGGFVFSSDLHFYFLSWGLYLACYWFCKNLMDSRFGRAIRSLNDSETASKSLGVDIAKYKLQVFILTAVMASLSGSLFCFYLRFTEPGSYGFPLLVELLMMIVLGGVGSIKGALIGSFTVLWLREVIHTYLSKVFPVMTAEVDAVFFGILIIIILIFMPEGLTAWVDQLTAFGKRLYGSTKSSRTDLSG